MLATLQRYSRTVSEKYLVPAGFWFVTVLIYLPAYKAGFFFDFHSMLEQYHQQSFWDFVNRKGIGHHSLYQVTQIILYTLVRLFGINPVPWFILFTGLHALNASLIYRLFARYFQKINYQPAKQAALLGAFLFLISPVQAEVVIWKATLHYLTGLLYIILILTCTLSFLETQQKKFLWRILIVYFISTFTLEIFYLTPAFVLVLITSLKLSGNISAEAFKNSLVKIFLPLVGLWLVYLFAFHLVYDQWIAHYSVNIQSSFTPDQIIGKLNKYFLHVYLMEYSWDGEWRTKAYELTSKLPVLVASGALILAILGFGIWKFRSLKPAGKALITLFILTLISFVLILPMWFSDMFLMRNDRYYYLPSVFMFMLLSVLLFKISVDWLRKSVSAIYITWCIIGTLTIVLKARQAAKIFHGITNHFYWQNASTVLLLNLPNNISGIGIIPANDPDEFNSHLQIFGKGSVNGKVYSVSSYNMQNDWDGAHVTVLDSTQLKVTLNQWGTWWWFRSYGATDYENEMFEVKMTDPGHEYHLRLKQKPDSNTVILYQQGDQWRKVDMSITGDEQW